MYGDGPCQAQGVLTKLALNLLAYLLGILVDDIACIGPHIGLHHNLLPIIDTAHADALSIYGAHDAQLAVIVARALRVVLEKHHLTSLLEHELLLGWVGRLGEGARHIGPKGEANTLEGIHAFLIVAVGRSVVGGEADGTINKLRTGLRMTVCEQLAVVHTTIQPCKALRGESVLAHFVEDIDKGAVGLTIHVRELYGHMLRLLQGMTAEEVGRMVILAQEAPLTILHHRSQLAEVANHEQLHPSEGAVAILVKTQYGINLVEKVGTHHGDLINDEQVERTDDVLLLLTEPILLILRIERASRDVGRQRELKERVYGDTARIDGRHTCGCYHHHTLRRTLLEAAQEGGLARACLAREEHIHSRALHKLPREVQLLVATFFFHSSYFSHLRGD